MECFFEWQDYELWFFTVAFSRLPQRFKGSKLQRCGVEKVKWIPTPQQDTRNPGKVIWRTRESKHLWENRETTDWVSWNTEIHCVHLICSRKLTSHVCMNDPVWTKASWWDNQNINRVPWFTWEPNVSYQTFSSAEMLHPVQIAGFRRSESKTIVDLL